MTEAGHSSGMENSKKEKGKYETREKLERRGGEGEREMC